MDTKKIKEELLGVIPKSVPVSDELLDCVAGGLALGLARPALADSLARFGLADNDLALILDSTARLTEKKLTDTKLAETGGRII